MPDEDLTKLLSRLKTSCNEDQRTIPPAVATAFGVLAVDLPKNSEDSIGEVYNFAMRMRQIRQSSPTVATDQYLKDVAILQDLVVASLIAGVEQVIASQRKAKEPTTQEPERLPETKETLTTVLREFSRALGAFQERVDDILEDAER